MITSDIHAQVHMTINVGPWVLLWNRLTMAEDKAPKAICKKPNNADAEPALDLKDERAIAEAFGKIKPWNSK